jgi:hypothetical protein
MQAALMMGPGINAMRRFSILAVVLVVVGAIFTGVVFPVVAHPRTAARDR